MATDPLTSWTDGPAKQAIIDFIDVVKGGGDRPPVPVEERVATFDNDGTLWCEKPMPIQLDFFLRRWVEMAEAEPDLRGQQPWKAAYERDHAWLGETVDQHYQGDDSRLKILAGGILQAFAEITVEDFASRSEEFLRTAQHPTLGFGYLESTYRPMVELLEYLADNGFTNYIASGGGRDFMRPVTEELYGIPPEHVIGSSTAFSYQDGKVTHKPELDYLDDGTEKPIRIWDRVGRRPILAAGNSNGDIPMLEFTVHTDRPTLQLLVLHDDAEREFAYTTGADQALERAARDGWTVISVENDWKTVF
jgi:FMN phosphatase YigB (HAD superfamily)